jgi:ribosomal-protein-alanine N-acetyltransferase
MREALEAVIRYAFTELGFNRLEADPLAINERSRRLLLNLGFRYEGTLRGRVRYRDEYLDQTYYGLLRKDWEAGHR